MAEHLMAESALWMQYAQEIGEAKRALEVEKTAHQQAVASAAIRGVCKPAGRPTFSSEISEISEAFRNFRKSGNIFPDFQKFRKIFDH